MQYIDEILKYGQDILDSYEFTLCKIALHHKHVNVAYHSIRVAYYSLRVCDMLERIGFKPDRRAVVRVALCHDIAMPALRSRASFTLAWEHPVLSAKKAEMFGLNKKERKMIARHMWPICILPPTSMEGWVLTIADKYCAVGELTGVGSAYKRTDLRPGVILR